MNLGGHMHSICWLWVATGIFHSVLTVSHGLVCGQFQGARVTVLDAGRGDEFRGELAVCSPHPSQRFLTEVMHEVLRET